MNKRAIAALAALAVSLTTTVASAGVVTPANDLIIGFQDENGNGSGSSNVPSNLEVDLGNISLYTTTYSATLSNVTLSDLSTIYSSNWLSTSSGVNWSVAGVTTTAQTFDDTSADASVPNSTGTARATAYNQIAQLAGGMNGQFAATLGDTNSKGVNLGTSANPATGIANSYTSLETQQGNASGFGFTGDDEAVGAGSIELFQISGSGSNAAPLGFFDLSSSGVLTYEGINAGAVPEPSAYALGICAILLFIVLRRRQMVA